MDAAVYITRVEGKLFCLILTIRSEGHLSYQFEYFFACLLQNMYRERFSIRRPGKNLPGHHQN